MTHRLLAACLALAAGNAFAHVARPVPDAEAHRPSDIPDRIIRTVAGDPATVIGVTWRTAVSGAPALAEIALADAGPKFTAGVKSVRATSALLRSDLGEARYHSAVFDGLKPATLYAYRVGDGANWSEWVHAKTASDKVEPFSFVYFGDAQNDIKSLWSRVIRGAYSDAPKMAFLVHAGDLVNRSLVDAEWGDWHRAGGWVNAMVPSVPVPGNHEYPKIPDLAAIARLKAEGKDPAKEKTQPTQNILTPHWQAQFALPGNGPKGLKDAETAYWFDHQGVRFVCLNSNVQHDLQAAWLEDVLARNPQKWTILTFHHPVYSAAKDRDSPRLRAAWQPIIDKYKVDLVLTGHDHTYARSGLRTAENVASGASLKDAGGTVYVVSVSGPKMYNLEKKDWMKRAAEDTQLYQIISIDSDRLHYRALTAVGDLYDAFTLVKRTGRPNELVEQAPATPERLRPPAAAKPKAAAAN